MPAINYKIEFALKFSNIERILRKASVFKICPGKGERMEVGRQSRGRGRRGTGFRV